MGKFARGLLAVTALTVALGGVLAGSALAGNSRPAVAFTSPSPAQGTTVTSSSVTFAFVYNRTPKQTRSLSCSLTGPTSSSGACDQPTAASGGSSSGASYSGLANGSYTLTVTGILTDGGTFSASRTFTVDAVSAAQMACQADGGTYSTDPASDLVRFEGSFLWSCNGGTTPTPGGALIGACVAGGGASFEEKIGDNFSWDSSCYQLV